MDVLAAHGRIALIHNHRLHTLAIAIYDDVFVAPAPVVKTNRLTAPRQGCSRSGTQADTATVPAGVKVLRVR